jgi:excisionase family DNA binding protein
MQRFSTICDILQQENNTHERIDFMLSDYSDYLTPYEVADELCLSLTTVYNLLRAGKLPGFKVGKSWRVPREMLERIVYR